MKLIYLSLIWLFGFFTLAAQYKTMGSTAPESFKAALKIPDLKSEHSYVSNPKNKNTVTGNEEFETISTDSKNQVAQTPHYSNKPAFFSQLQLPQGNFYKPSQGYKTPLHTYRFPDGSGGYKTYILSNNSLALSNSRDVNFVFERTSCTQLNMITTPKKYDAVDLGITAALGGMIQLLHLDREIEISR